MERLVAWYNRRSDAVRLLVSSMAVAVPFYFSALLSYWVSQEAALGVAWRVGLHAAVLLVLITAIVFFARSFASVQNKIEARKRSQIRVKLDSYYQIDRVIANKIQRLDTSLSHLELVLLGFDASRQALEDIVAAAYNAFVSAYGKSADSDERVDFEVTFMTRSYRDNEITIPAYANRDGRSPLSMGLREEKPQIYQNSVTATVYRETRPSIHIVEDTSDPAVDYKELYSEQRKRIRSSIIYPVKSDTNKLLGTLVVHCDKTGFFRRADEKYWSDVLEIFAKRLALRKKKLDLAVGLSQSTGEVVLQWPPPPF